MKIIGLKPYSMAATDTGEIIKGVTVFCSYERKGIEGVGTDSFSISDRKLDGKHLEVGMEIKAFYDQYGKKVQAVQIVA